MEPRISSFILILTCSLMTIWYSPEEISSFLNLEKKEMIEEKKYMENEIIKKQESIGKPIIINNEILKKENVRKSIIFKPIEINNNSICILKDKIEKITCENIYTKNISKSFFIKDESFLKLFF